MINGPRALEQLRLTIPETSPPTDLSSVNIETGSLELISRRFEASSWGYPNFYGQRPDLETVMVDEGSTFITAHLGEAKIIGTSSLAGCTAAAIVAELPDGSRMGYVQHFAPNYINDSVEALQRGLQNIFPKAKSAKVIIMAEGERQLDPINSKWVMVTSLPGSVQPLIEVTEKRAVDIPLDVEVCLYPNFEDLDSDDRYSCGTLEVEFLPDGQTAIRTEISSLNTEEKEFQESYNDDRGKDWLKHWWIYRAMGKQCLFETDSIYI